MVLLENEIAIMKMTQISVQGTIVAFKQDATNDFISMTDITHAKIGASLKDLGKKWFAFSLLDAESFGLFDKIKEALK